MKTILLLICLLPLPLLASREVERLKEIVSINSGSANISGVAQVLKTARPWFEALGFKVTFIENPEGNLRSAPLFVAELPGQRPETITFIMHADTVFEQTSSFQKFHHQSDLVHGP